MNIDSGKIRVSVLGITYSNLQQGAYVLVLGQEDGSRRVPIVVGTAEAQSIAIRIENLTPPRPMTHDFIVSLGEELGIVYDEVLIHRFEKGVFYSTIYLHQGERKVEMDARTSDAIAIAMRTDMPIYMTAEVMQQAGFDASQLSPRSNEKEVSDEPESYETMSNAELELRIEQAVASEAYEEAALIQQILRERNK